MVASPQSLVEHIIKQFVSTPDQVHVLHTQPDEACIIEIQVADQDRGRVIGRNGQTIRSIRALTAALMPKAMKISVDLAKVPSSLA